ncbi:MAG: MMPL family transporter, partial [Holophagales bacterium]|nr:MMPL family transporter [Holophagales bacterium]
MRDSLHRLALFAERHHRPILAIALAAMLVAGFLVSRIRFDPDVLSLLPEDDPAVKTFRETLDELGALDLLLVVVRVPEGAVLDPYQWAVGELGSSLRQMPEMEWVEYRLGQPEELLRTFYPQAFFFLDGEQREAVLRRLSPEGLETRASELRRQLLTPQSVALKPLLRLDPIGLSEVFFDRLDKGRGALGVDWTSGFYLSSDRRLFLMLAKPEGAAQDLEFTQGLVDSVERQVARLGAAWQDRYSDLIASGELPSRLDVAMGGGYLTALDDANLIRRDVLVNSVSSMGVVLLLFLFAFRRLGLLVYAFLPLSCGLLLTFGLAGATGDVLSAATSGCAALLVGLGIDFVIVSYGRYVEERRGGADSSTALARMTGSCGRAVVVGGITSAATFYSFTITEFTGLRQMGLLTATGILLCMGAVLILLPALLAWSEARHRRRQSLPTLYVHGFGAGRLVTVSMQHPRPVLLAGALLTVVTLAFLPRLEFESAIQNLRPEGNRGIQVQEEVSEHFGSNFKYMMLVLRGSTLDEVLDLATRAAEGAAPMVASGNLYRVDSVSALVPSPSRQAEVLAWLEENRASGLLEPASLAERLRSDLRAAGLEPTAFEEGLGLLGEAASATQP